MGGWKQDAVPDLSLLRRQRGLSLQEVVHRTRISPFYIRAIEKGEFGKLPGGIYSISYLRQYARTIDFNEEELLRLWEAQTGIPVRPPEPQPAPRKALTERLGDWLSLLIRRRLADGR
ncbi:MAG: helix-turn-helix domain-containing protein [Bryobacterales bacterium]|nr:helix-turn-helix domain-containing protein [Bryobacterales bacterium]